MGRCASFSLASLADAVQGVHPAAVITLYTMPGTDQLESFSPFCMKAEVYLKLQKIPYKRAAGDPRKAPKGKVPFMEADGTTIADSSAMLTYLEAKAEAPLDRGLDSTSRAQAHVLKRLFEESLYWCLLWSRWGDDEGWSELRKHVEQFVPAALRWLVPGLIRKKVIAQAASQGTGRHSREEIYALGKADLEAISTILGDKPYFLGNDVHTIDVIAYSFLANIMRWTKPSPLCDAARAYPNLEAYVDRMATRLESSAKAKDAEAA